MLNGRVDSYTFGRMATYNGFTVSTLKWRPHLMKFRIFKLVPEKVFCTT